MDDDKEHERMAASLLLTDVSPQQHDSHLRHQEDGTSLAPVEVARGAERRQQQRRRRMDEYQDMVMDILTNNGLFQAMEFYLQKGNIVPELSGSGPYTIVAPWNGALLDNLDLVWKVRFQNEAWVAHLQNFLHFHIHLGDLSSLLELVSNDDGETDEYGDEEEEEENVDNQWDIVMANGENVTVTVGTGGFSLVRFNGRVVIADFHAMNGNVYLVSDFLRPAWLDLTLGDVVQASFPTLLNLLVLVELDDVVAQPETTMTIFAPDEDVLANMDQNMVDFLQADEGMDILIHLLLTHMVEGDPLASINVLTMLPREYTTMSGQTIELASTGNRTVVQGPFNEVFINRFDILAGNGIVHGIDSIIWSTALDLTPSPSPSTGPTTLPPTSPRCFESPSELQTAVHNYLEDPSGTLTASHYGHPIGRWCVSEIEDFSRLFDALRNPLAASFNEDIGDWDVSSATSFWRTFRGAVRFNQDLSRWDVSNAVDFGFMFSNATSFNADLSFWYTQSAVSFSYMFSDATAFDSDLSAWDVSGARSFNGMFSGATSFTGTGLEVWDMGQATDLAAMFYQAEAFNADLSTWDVSRVERLLLAFARTPNFDADLSNWNVQAVTDLSFAFAFGTSFASDISRWDVSSVTQMPYTFAFAPSFNSDISSWQVYNVEEMSFMFQRASSFRQDLCPWGQRLQPTTTVDSAFAGSACPLVESPDFSVIPPGPFCFGCSGETTTAPSLMTLHPSMSPTSFPTPIPTMPPSASQISSSNGTSPSNNTQSPIPFPKCFESGAELASAVDEYLVNASGTLTAELYGSDIGSWCVSEVGDFSRLFAVGRNPAAWSFNHDLSRWDTSKATTMQFMFSEAAQFNSDLPWNTSNVVDMFGMFNGASSFNTDISHWDTSKVEDMGFMFNRAVSFNTALLFWDTSKVRTMRAMFQSASSFNQEISRWDTSRVKGMGSMFALSLFNQDISRWNTSNVEDMSYMFGRSYSFNQDLSSWDTSNVMDMGYMFSSAQYFNSGVGSWNTSNVKDMASMFYAAALFNQDISHWDTSHVEDMSNMFARANSFNQDISRWNVSSSIYMSGMFYAADGFAQDLCPWGTQLLNVGRTHQDMNVNEMFLLTNCPLELDPYFNTTPPGPFCFSCNTTEM